MSLKKEIVWKKMLNWLVNHFATSHFFLTRSIRFVSGGCVHFNDIRDWPTHRFCWYWSNVHRFAQLECQRCRKSSLEILSCHKNRIILSLVELWIVVWKIFASCLQFTMHTIISILSLEKEY